MTSSARLLAVIAAHFRCPIRPIRTIMDPSIYRLRQQDILTFCVLALLCLGAIMVQSASMNVTGKLGMQWTAMGIKQAEFCVVALIVFFLIGRVDYSPMGRHAV